jgi:ubiquinone/menaquinone biosynthesis C-methylase UbiE
MRPSLIAGGFFALTQFVPRWRVPLWRFWYDALAKRDAHNELLFMNYGYDDGSRGLTLQPADEVSRYGIQLYAATLQGLEVAGKDVLEVGSGRGGGGSYLARYRAPASYTGVDLSKAAVERCRRDLALPGVKWLQGEAGALPVDSHSMDIVLNVESSHSYPSMPDFLKEVYRVLRGGGYFAFADVRKADQLPELEMQVQQSGLVRTGHAIITPQVLCALNGISRQRECQIDTRVPRLYRAAFRDFAGVKDSVLYTMLADGRLVYVRYLLEKPR